MSNLKSIRIALTVAFVFIAMGLSAQTKVTVLDATGEPLIGASVIEKGTQNGGVTDFDGIFVITPKGQQSNHCSFIHRYEDKGGFCYRKERNQCNS